MVDIVKMMSDYGVTFIIVALFIYAWIDDRKNRNQMLDNSLKLEHNNNEILSEMKKTNENTSKSLELLHISLNNQTEFLKEHDEGQKQLAKDIQKISVRLEENNNG